MSGDIVMVYPSNSAHPKIIRIPDTEVWLAGDNPSNSTDSRSYGSVSESLLKGRVIGKFTSSYPFFQKISRQAPEDKTDYFEINRRLESAAEADEARKARKQDVDLWDIDASELLTKRIQRERDHVSGYQAVQARRAIVEAEESGLLKPEEALDVRRRILGPEDEDRQSKIRLMKTIQMQRQRAEAAARRAAALEENESTAAPPSPTLTIVANDSDKNESDEK